MYVWNIESGYVIRKVASLELSSGHSEFSLTLLIVRETRQVPVRRFFLFEKENEWLTEIYSDTTRCQGEIQNVTD